MAGEEAASGPFDLVASTLRGKAAAWGNLDLHSTPWLEADLPRLVPEHRDVLDHAGELSAELDGYIDRHGAVTGVETFLDAGANPEELLDRRAVALLVARLCVEWSGPQPRLPVPAELCGHGCRRRPLRPLEVALVRADAYDDVTCLTALRLVGAGASVAEAARVRATAVQPCSSGPARIRIPGGRGRHPRTLVLPPRSELDLAELVTTSIDGFLLPLGDAEGDKDRMEALDGRIRTTLDRCGFTPGGPVTASSVRLAGLGLIADRFGFEAALHCSGSTSAARLRDELDCPCRTGA